MAADNFPHDAAYKTFFKYPYMVQSLIGDFLPKEISAGFDFATLEQCPASYITPDLRERHDDLIWRVKWRQTWCYIYILLEFQSQRDYWMGLRVLTYTALLWQDLVKNGVVKTHEKLPPVLPIVIYNGLDDWNAPLNVRELVAETPPALKIFQPGQEYFLLDENRVSQALLDAAKGESAYLLRFERSSNRAELEAVYAELKSRLNPEVFAPLLRDISQWLTAMVAKKQLRHETDNICGDGKMLEEKLEQWSREYYAQGEAAGRVAGKAIGKSEGIIEGLARGIANQHSVLLDMLSDRFGHVPANWRLAITKIQDMATLNSLTRAIWKVKSLEDFGQLLPTGDKDR